MKRKSFSLGLSLFILILLPGIWFITTHPRLTSAAWFDDSFAYRNLLPITSHTALESNVYITATINTSASGQFQADCGDLRFTDTKGKLLKYYIVSGCTTASTVVHIFFESFPAGAQELYYYYGNPNVANGFASADFSTVATSYVVGSVAAQEVSQAPIAFWKFDEGNGTTTADSSANGNTGTLTSSPTWLPDDQCISNKCLLFNGSSSYVNSGSSSKLALTGAMSISAWFKNTLTTYATPAYRDIVAKGGVFTNNTAYAVGFRVMSASDIRPYFYWRNGATLYGTEVSNVLPNDFGWHHITATRDSSSNLSIYIDGKLVGTDGSNSAPVDGSQSVYLGYGTEANADEAQWQGGLDEIKIYGYARTAAQIKADYNAGKSHAALTKGGNALGTNKNNAEFLSKGLVGYWKMDEASGNALDSSGNSNTAVPTGTTVAVGKFGSGRVTSATGNYLTVTGSSTTAFTSSVTFSSWVYLTSYPAGGLSRITGRSDSSFELAVDSAASGLCGQGKLAIYTPSTSWICSTSTLSLTTWYHVVTIFDGSRWNIYLNGSLVYTNTSTSTISIGGNMLFGAATGGSEGFPGTVDEFRFYNRALSPNEVRQLADWTPGPFAYYKLDENSGTTSGDSSGNNFTSSWTGSPSWITGKSGSALYFNGSSFVNFYSASLAPLFLGSSGSVSMWIKVPNSAFWTEGVTRTPFQIGTDANNRIMVQKTTTSNQIDLNYTAGASSTTYSYATTRTDWFHLAIVWSNPGYARFYVDGKRVQSSVPAATYTGSLASDRAVFGINTTSSNQWFTGSVDDLRLYNYPRTDAQIIEDMNFGHPVGGSPVGSQLAYLKFDEGYGSTAYNSGSTGSTQNGTITGATWTTSGKFSKALSFAGSTNQVSIPTITSASALSFWLNPSTTSQNLFALSATAYLTTSSGTITATGFTSPTIYVDGVSGGKIKAGVWQHVAVTTNTPITANAITVGRANGTSLTGSIDEVKIYAGPLSSSDVLLDYNRGQALVLGNTGTDSTGLVADNSAARAYCIPGDTTACTPPIAEWNFEEKTSTTANDTSGNGNPGTLTLGPLWSVGKIGTSVEFDGSDDYVRAIDSSTLDISSSHTLEAWINPDTLPSASRIRNVVGKTGDQDLETAGTQTNYGLAIDNGLSGVGQGVTCGFEDAAHANYAGRFTVTLPTGQWSHLTCVFDDTANTITIYVNGVFGSQTAAAGTPATQAQDLYIGISNASALFSLEEYFDGKIDNIRIYNYARTAAQVAWDYNRGGPIAHYKFDECQGDTMNDAMGDGLSGTWTGAGSGTQTAVGTCSTSGTAWGNGSSGKFNSSLNFDGTNDVITVADNNILDLTSNLSISFWINTTVTNASGRILTKMAAANNPGYDLMLWNGDVNPMVNAAFDWTSTVHVNPNEWTHIVWTKSGTLSTIYKNGVLADTNNTTPAAITANAASMFLGGAYTSFISGKLDDVRLYNYALTATQIKQIYNNTSINFGPSTGTP